MPESRLTSDRVMSQEQCHHSGSASGPPLMGDGSALRDREGRPLGENPDDERSDLDIEDFPEQWVAGWGSAEDEDEDDGQGKHSPAWRPPMWHYPSEPENWDAEMLVNECPYDEEDLVSIDEEDPSPGHILCAEPLGKDSLYLPSLHHSLPQESFSKFVVSTFHAEVGQFEDAEL